MEVRRVGRNNPVIQERDSGDLYQCSDSGKISESGYFECRKIVTSE